MIELYDPTETEPKPNSEFERIISDILASIILFLIEPFVFYFSFFYYMIKDKIDNIRQKKFVNFRKKHGKNRDNFKRHLPGNGHNC